MSKLPSPLAPNELPERKNWKRDQMSAQELSEFMKLHGISEYEMSELLGVTPQAVRLWLTGQRPFSVLNSRLIRMFQKYPQLIKVF